MCIWLFGVIKNLQCATPKMEHFVIIVNGWKPLTIITKRSILEAANYYHKALHPGCCSSPRSASNHKGKSYFTFFYDIITAREHKS